MEIPRSGLLAACLLAAAPSWGSPPALVVDRPADGTYTNRSPVTVSGRATSPGAGQVTLTVGGMATSLGDGGRFSAAAPLQEGSNGIAVVATDGHGGASTLVRTVTLVTVPPAIAITGVADG